MRVGYTTIFQGSGNPSDDQRVYTDELRLCDLAEPLGFEAIWATEHHFTSYTMCPDPVQFLSYMAGRTKNILLGSGAVIMPWHDPVRVAEQVTVLDLMSNGRFIFGMGRGLGRIEFEGLRIPMDESRARFVESAEVVLRALETGVLEADGK
jgi:alkanesulfonate monooxygenase SsuD/methylene tetrahydromethanopterin reductase-like flavin-dependent oxidoreductase (luciferase family)